MANNVKHNRDVVIQKATNLFWEKGFHATSMRNLQDHIDMRPGSVYAAFGSKEGLFKETLQCYANVSLQRLDECIEQNASPLQALKAFIKSIVQCENDTSPNEVCMLVKTVAELTEENAELLAESKRLLNVMEDAFEGVLRQAKALGELRSESDTRRLARFLQMQLIGLRAYARVNQEDARVDELVEDAFACLR